MLINGMKLWGVELRIRQIRIAPRRKLRASTAVSRTQERTALACELETLELEQKLISARRAARAGIAFPDTPGTNSFVIGAKMRIVSPSVRRPPRCFSSSMGKQKDRTFGIFAGLLQ